MKKAIVVLLFIAAAAGLIIIFASGSDESKMGPDVLYLVNGEPLHTSDLQYMFAMLPEEEKKNYVGPNGFLELLEEMVIWKLMAQKAEDKGLDEEPQVKRKVENFRNNLLVNALVNQTITEEEIFNYFQNNYMHAIFIMVRFPPDASEAEIDKARKLARKIYNEAEESEDFRKVGKKYSKQHEKVVIGDMGYLTKEDVANQAGQVSAEVLFGLKNPGDFTEPVKSKEGFFIFMALETPRSLNPRGISPRLRDRLMDVKREEIIRSYANQFKTSDDIRVKRNDEAIKDLVRALSSQWKSSAQAGDTAGPALRDTPDTPKEIIEDVSEAVGSTLEEGAGASP